MTSQIVFRSQVAQFTSAMIETTNLSLLADQLHDKLSNTPAHFFSTTPFVANLKGLQQLDSAWLEALIALFKKAELPLIGLTEHPFPENVLAQYHLADIPSHHTPAKTEKPQAAEKPTAEKTPEVAPPAPAVAPAPPTMVLKQHVRSGQRIYAPNSDLTIIGTVGAGAEVIADGNITVLGPLRGRAFAGAHGDAETHIFCLKMAAELVSIAGNYQTMEQLDAYRNLEKCLISLNSDETMHFVSL